MRGPKAIPKPSPAKTDPNSLPPYEWSLLDRYLPVARLAQLQITPDVGQEVRERRTAPGTHPPGTGHRPQRWLTRLDQRGRNVTTGGSGPGRLQQSLPVTAGHGRTGRQGGLVQRSHRKLGFDHAHGRDQFGPVPGLRTGACGTQSEVQQRSQHQTSGQADGRGTQQEAKGNTAGRGRPDEHASSSGRQTRQGARGGPGTPSDRTR